MTPVVTTKKNGLTSSNRSKKVYAISCETGKKKNLKRSVIIMSAKKSLLPEQISSLVTELFSHIELHFFLEQLKNTAHHLDYALLFLWYKEIGQSFISTNPSSLLKDLYTSYTNFVDTYDHKPLDKYTFSFRMSGIHEGFCLDCGPAGHYLVPSPTHYLGSTYPVPLYNVYGEILDLQTGEVVLQEPEKPLYASPGEDLYAFILKGLGD